MRPAPFEYMAPTQLADVVGALANQADARVLAGGQSLIPLMNFRMAVPSLLVDINRVEHLRDIEEAETGVSIGATVRQEEAIGSPLVAQRCPLVARALGFVGHPQIRSRGTVVGSLMHHDPSAELPAVAIALDARVTVHSTRGSRVVPAAALFTGHFTTSLATDEVAASVWFPESPPGSGAAYAEIARRKGDFALVGVAAELTVVDGMIQRAAVALSAVADRPVRATLVEKALVGSAPGTRAWRAAADAVLEEPGIDPPSDAHATSEYRREVLPVLVDRALRSAAHAAAPGR